MHRWPPTIIIVWCYFYFKCLGPPANFYPNGRLSILDSTICSRSYVYRWVWSAIGIIGPGRLSLRGLHRILLWDTCIHVVFGACNMCFFRFFYIYIVHHFHFASMCIVHSVYALVWFGLICLAFALLCLFWIKFSKPVAFCYSNR